MRSALVLVLAIALFLSALSLVTAQHRARSLFIDLERAQSDAKRLDVEYERWRIEQAKLAQPAHIAAEARKIGLKPIDTERTQLVPRATRDGR